MSDKDEFLYRLRVRPSAEFAARLKAKLDRQSAGASAPGSRRVRPLVIAVLIGGAAFAATLLSMRGGPAAFLDFFRASDTTSTPITHMAHRPAATNDSAVPDVSPRKTTPRPAPLASHSMLADDPTQAAVHGKTAAGLHLLESKESSPRAQQFTAAIPTGSPRDYISIVGSPVMYPLTKRVADRFGEAQRFKPPKIEITGTTGGLKHFCNGIGPQHPDIAMASRRMRTAEFDTCARNGVADIVEAKIGYSAVVIARLKSGGPLTLSARDIYLALAKKIPDSANPRMLIDNSNTSWNQVNSALEDQKIQIFGPPLPSPLRGTVAELILEAGCNTYPWIRAMKDVDEGRYNQLCHTLRQDGAYLESEPTNTLITQNLAANPGAIAILDYNFFKLVSKHVEDQLVDNSLQSVDLEGVGPTLETIVAGTYPASRTLHLYVKKAHIGAIAGLQQFIAEYLNDAAIGPYGYLGIDGLIPLNDAERRAVRADPLALKTFEP